MPSTPGPDPDADPHHGPGLGGERERESLLERLDHLKDTVEEAAIAAEFETGEREETIEEAKAHALVRTARMALGSIIVLIGIAALPLPGPGWLIIAGGLTILAKDVAWADRLLRYIRKRVPGIPEDGKIPRSSMVTMAVVTLAAVSASLWWTLARGSDEIQPGLYAAAEAIDPTRSTSVTDPGIEVDVTLDGPVTVSSEGCDTIELAVTNRSKTSFDVEAVDDAEWSCSNDLASRFVAAAVASELTLEYSTSGPIGWLLADDRLSSITTDSESGIFRLTFDRD